MAEQHQAIVADLGGDITELQRNMITDYLRTRREARGSDAIF